MLRDLHRRFDWYYIGQIYSGDFAKFCSLLRIYELEKTVYIVWNEQSYTLEKPQFCEFETVLTKMLYFLQLYGTYN